MNILAAILLALAIIAGQVLHGGLLVPVFTVPGDGLLVVAAMVAIAAAFRNPAPGAPSAFASAIILIGYLLWRCLHSHDQFFGRIEFGQVLALGLAFMIAYCGLTSTRSRYVLLGILMTAAVGQTVVGMIQFARGELVAPLGWFSADLRAIYEARFSGRAHGFFLNPNQLSWLLSWASLMCVSLASWGRVRVITRVVLIYLALMFIAGNVLTGSRGGLLSFVGGMAVFCCLSVTGVLVGLRRGRILALSGALLVVVICLGVGGFIYSSNWVVQGRMDAMHLPDIRDYLFEHARRQFETAPLLGGGPGSFIYAARLYRTHYQPNDAFFAHDDWLQTLVEYGFVGFAISLVGLLVLLMGGMQRFFAAIKRQEEVGARPQSNGAAILIGTISATCAFCLHSLTDFNLHVPANGLLAAVTMGLLAGTGGELADKSRRLQAGVLRAFGGLVTACLAALLGFFIWSYGRADYRSLLALNALAEGDVKTSLAESEEGLKTAPHDAGLLASQGRSLYSYESSLQFEGSAESDADADTADDGSADVASDEAEAESDDDADNAPELTPAERTKFYRGAAEAFSSALLQQPGERGYHIELANALAECGDRQQAERQLIEAIRLDPAHGYAYASYADFLYENDRPERALRIYSLGAALPGGDYCGGRVQDLREEMAPPTDEEPAEAAEDDSGEATESKDPSE